MKTKSLFRTFSARFFIGTAAAIAAIWMYAEALPTHSEVIPAHLTDTGNEKETKPARATPDEFIIFGWGAIPDFQEGESWGDFADMDAVMRDMYDCGLNATTFIYVKNLKYARKNNLMGMLQPTYYPSTPQQVDAWVNKMMDSITDPLDRDAVFAIFTADEPSTSLFPLLKNCSEALRKQGVRPYINILSERGFTHNYPKDNYQEYLDQFVDLCKPSYLSFAYYAFLQDGQFYEDRFCNNIELIRKKSLETGIPFLNVILSCAHLQFAEPTEAMLSFQVYATLAYGGKGIGYFTYFTGQKGNYRLAPIDRFGYRTKTWGMMRNVNLQVHSLVPVYKKLQSVNVFHTGNVPQYGRDINSAKTVQSVNGDSLLIGEFIHSEDGKPYVMVVNKSIRSSVALDVKFKEEGRIMIVSQFNQGRVHFVDEQKWLAPGSGVLLTVE